MTSRRLKMAAAIGVTVLIVAAVVYFRATASAADSTTAALGGATRPPSERARAASASAPPFIQVGTDSKGEPIYANFVSVDASGVRRYRSPSGKIYTR